ncbi:hypothetical protein [Sinorhizobium arboris]|uniref:hypothetical protein n=1 Tax=Sinorhizobium arboris TaxID=76745 RepID=UPI0004209444|nr:hypothetical protein [Sinorhizobium arboris]
MNNIAKPLINSVMTSLVVCGLLALIMPLFLERPEIPDYKTFLTMFVVIALALSGYELIFKRDR